MEEKSFDSLVVDLPPSVCEFKPVVPPIYQTSIFEMPDYETAVKNENATRPNSYYTRWGNPTVVVLEKMLANLEGAETALAFPSGMAAIFCVLYSTLNPGDHILCCRSIYTDTSVLLTNDFPNLGVEVTFFDNHNTEEIFKQVRPNTKVIYLESPDNPNLNIVHIEAVSSYAREKGILTVVDNTFATPYCQNPIKLGADVVVHSLTKYISGHMNVVAGAIVTNNMLAKRFWEKQILIGSCIDPHSAWLLIQSIQTLAVRLNKQIENATLVAKYLATHPKVKTVIYPGLSSHPQHELAKKQMKGFGAIISFELDNGIQETVKVVEGTKLFKLAVSLGGVRSLIEHASTMSHSKISKDDGTYVPRNLIRLSIGIEDPNDLIKDLEKALAG